MQAATCADPIPLDLGAAVAVDGGVELSFTVNTASYSDNQTGGCNTTSSGPEAVYSLTLTSARDVTISAARPAGNTSSDPVVYVRNAPCATGTELACQDSASSAATETVTLINRQPGTYFVFVEHYGTPTAPGAVDVVVRLSAPTLPPMNDQCPGAVVTLTPLADGGVGESAAFSVNSIGATDDYVSSCAATGAPPEVMYQFTLTAPRDVLITARAATGSLAEPALFLRSGTCASGTELGCSNRVTDPQIVQRNNLAAGTYFFGVETFTPGLIDVTIDTGPATVPPANDTCAQPQALTFAGNVATASGNTTAATNDNLAADPNPTCSSTAKATGRDLVYSYTLASAQDVVINVTGTAGFQPAAYVRTTCAGTATTDQLACTGNSTSTPANIAIVNQPAGTYFVWVDSMNDSVGPFTLTVTTTNPNPVPLNDLCSAPAPLFPDGGTAGFVTGTLIGSTHQYTATCSPTSTPSGPDVVYAFSTATTQKLTVTANVNAPLNDGGMLRPNLYVRPAGSCLSDAGIGNAFDGGALLELPGCASALGYPEPGKLVVSSLPAGNYLLFVDTYENRNSSVGPFSLTSTLGALDPVPTNDTCAAAQTITLVNGRAVVEGTTVGAANDYVGTSCSVAGSGAGSSDLVYSFTTPATGGVDGGIFARLSVQTLNQSEYQPAIYVRSACADDAGVQVGCSAMSTGIRHYATTFVQGLAPNTQYFAWVDSNSSTTSRSGPFKMSVELTPGQPNDTCAGAIPVTANTSIVGSTTGAINDYTSTNMYSGNTLCGNTLSGPEVVYSYTAATTGPVVVRVLPERTTDLGLAVVQNACAPMNCVDTEENNFNGDPETVSFAATAGTTYFIFVDSFSNSAGGNTSNPSGQGGFILSVQQ